MTDIVYLHGKLGSPQSDKVTRLRLEGYDVVAPDLQELGLAERIIEAMRVIERVRPYLVIGSSLGGLTALCAMELLDKLGAVRHGNLLLLAPAVVAPYITSHPASVLHLSPPRGRVEILHETSDEVIDCHAVKKFAEARDMPFTSTLDGHRLAKSYDLIASMTASLIGFDVKTRNLRGEP